MWRETTYDDIVRIAVDSSSDAKRVLGAFPDTDGTHALLRRDAQTWEEGGEVLAIVGLTEMWNGVCSVWTLLTDSARSRGVALSLHTLRLLEDLHITRGFDRIQATCITGSTVESEWLKRLGFAFEGTMRGYGPDGADHDLYARVLWTR
jgi:RimJ/RimL family protein N-acetyltransferase